jgi:threonine synthase
MLAELPAIAVNPHWSGYRCTVCNRVYPPTWSHFVCEDCGETGILEATYNYSALAAEWGPQLFATSALAGDMWSFAPLLPLRPEAPHLAWAVGGTPLHAPERLREHLGFRRLFLKDDTTLPSASLKDRAAAVAIADAVRLGRHHLACASTGNAAASLVVLGARAGLVSTIFVPANAPPAKQAQLLLHGGRLIRVDGSYDQAYDLSLQAIAANGWYSRNCAHNPLLVEGKKTAALEIAAALDWQVPEAVFVPVGDGCIISSVGKAFRELRQLGLTDRVPRLYGVQAEGAAPLARAWARAGCQAGAMQASGILSLVETVKPATVADSIAVGVPRNRVKAWKAVVASEGAFLSVSDEAILNAVGLLACVAGLFAEPSGAAALAGLLSAQKQGLVTSDQKIVVMVTGHGLKDPEAAVAKLKLPDPIPPEGPLPAGA